MKKERVTLGKVIIVIFMVFAAFICLYPMLYVLSMSISAPEHVIRRDIFFLPKGFNLSGYKLLMGQTAFWTSYANTIFYVVVGTLTNLVMTVLTAYPLSRYKFFLRRQFSLMITITMFIGGGMIPFFIIVSNLGLYNSRWSMIIPFAVSAWNIILTRTFFESIPDSMIESASLDGANDLKILFRIILPLSAPIISVVALYCAVGIWNSYFWAMVLLFDTKLHPLQVYLRRVLIQLQVQSVEGGVEIGIDQSAQAEYLKYASIIFATLPILMIYPFLQRYFVKGVMVGAVKE